MENSLAILDLSLGEKKCINELILFRYDVMYLKICFDTAVLCFIKRQGADVVKCHVPYAGSYFLRCFRCLLY